MKKFIFTYIVLFVFNSTFSQNVGIGTNNPNPNAALEIFSGNKGLLLPRMDSNARNAIANIKGMMVFDTTTHSFWFNTGSNWSETVSQKGNNKGDMLYWNGSGWTLLPAGSNGQVLTMCGGLPHWGPCTGTLIISPSDNPMEVSYRSNTPTTSVLGDSVLGAWAWTISGSAVYGRFALQFDLSGIPSNAVIDSAKLYLYASPFPEYGNKISSDLGTANECYIQRITSPWTASAITWNTPPATTTVNEVTISQSASSFQNDTVNVTALINDIQANGNYGFAIQLQNETYYNIRQYASSYYSNAALHPTLVVAYH